MPAPRPFTRHAAVLLAVTCCLLAFLPAAADPPFAPPAYDEAALKADCEKYLQSLDPADFAKNYPKLLKGLLSLDAKTQADTLWKQRGLGEINALPFLIPLLQSPDLNVRVHAALAIESVVTTHSLQRRDPAIGEKVVLKPLTKDDPDLRPLAWLVLQMLRGTDGNTESYAATMAMYLELRQFKSELQALLHSRHPAVVTAAKGALTALDLPVPPD